MAKKKQPSSAEQHPAPGLRGYEHGKVRDVGYGGYSWSSTITGSNAHFLRFHYGGVYPQDYSNRAYGLQLRCLLE